MLTQSRRPVIKLMTDAAPPAVTLSVVPGPHRQRFTTEVAFFHTPAELDDCLTTPTTGRRVVLYGGRGVLPPRLAEMTDRVVLLAGMDPLKATILAHAGLRGGDTLTVLLPADWDGPPVETLLDHARRWFASPHSSEDEAVG